MPGRIETSPRQTASVIVTATLAVVAITCTVLTKLSSNVQVVRYGAALVLLWLLPGLAWFRCLQRELLERVASGAGLALVATSLTTLLLHLIPGPFPDDAARVMYLLLVLIPLAASLRLAQPTLSRRPTGFSRPEGFWAAVAVILVIAGLTRIVHLGYSEFQGDEAVIMQRTAQALAGDEAELFLHQKGPVEILVPMSIWAMTGTVSEWQMRLPFALTGLCAVISIMALTDVWFGHRASLLAGSLVAINGFLIAFARIIQYQNLVVMMGTLALLWMMKYQSERRFIQLALASVFFALGMLAHYDTVLAGPAAAAAFLVAIAKRPEETGQRIAEIVAAAGIGTLILALFYVPFVTNPMFSRTFDYLVGGRLGSGLLNNSLWDVWRMSAFYNSIYYVIGLIICLVIGALMRVGSLEAWLTFGVPFLFYTFIVADPRTHVYTFYPGAAILTGAVLSSIASSAPWQQLRMPAGLLLALWYGVCIGYIIIAFVSHEVEYKRAWPESRHPLYPVPFSDEELPPYGHFGFPYRAGWKAVEHLFATDVLEGTYASNEEPEVTTWYVRSGVRTMCGRPDVYVVAENVQDEIVIDWEELERDYQLIGQVHVGDAPKIHVYGRDTHNAEVRILAAQDYESSFDRQTSVDNQLPFGHGTERLGAFPAGQKVGDVAQLLGYDLSRPVIERGRPLEVVLYWRALSSPTQNYQVFTHLVQGDELVAQHDGAPACAHAPTSLWEAGEVIRDEHTIQIDRDVPLGELTLHTGMYHLLTFDRLPIDGGPTDSILLKRMEVIP